MSRRLGRVALLLWSLTGLAAQDLDSVPPLRNRTPANLADQIADPAERCVACHDPHGHDSASNPTSLKFRDQPDLMCTGCHRQFQDAAAVARHSHHAADAEASRCVSCHMPRIMDALLFRARYHQIDDIPSAEMTKRFGQEKSPNACLMCHTKKDADWLQTQLSSWKGQRGTAR